MLYIESLQNLATRVYLNLNVYELYAFCIVPGLDITTCEPNF